MPVTTDTTTIEESYKEEFKTSQVLPIAGAHFVHDIYTATIAPLLPVIIERLSLSLTQAGALTVFLQIPSLLNPFIGYLADRISLRYFVIFAPAVTATLISSLSFIDSYVGMIILLLVTGISVAAFHAPAPAMIARVSGNQIGLGMSLFMAAGELSRTIGPLIAVWAVTTWTLDGFYRIVVLGWAMSAVLYFRLRSIPARSEPGGSISGLKPFIRRLFLPLAVILLLRNFMVVGLTTYLPTYISMEGASLWLAGISLSTLEIAGVGGALLSGTLSDRLGRKNVLLVASVLASLSLVLLINVEGLLLFPVLLLLGFTSLSFMPVMLAIIQDQLPNHRALGNGLFIFLAFATQSIAVIIIGIVGDRYGLTTAYYISAILALGAIPIIFLLPSSKNLSTKD